MLVGERYTGIRNLIVQFVNSIKMNLPPGKVLFFNMANPQGLNLANEMYSILNVDSILIQNYDNDNYLGMISSSLSWLKSVKFVHSPKFILLLPFFSRRAGQGVSSKEILQLSAKKELGSSIEKGICVFYEYDKRTKIFLPCYQYF